MARQENRDSPWRCVLNRAAFSRHASNWQPRMLKRCAELHTKLCSILRLAARIPLLQQSNEALLAFAQ
eukprot:983507-Pleurochrysis_carterae.AAC.1